MPFTLNPLEQLFFTSNQAPSLLLDMYGGHVARIVLAGIRLNVFEALAKEPTTAATLAKRLDADERGISLLLKTLAALGYLKSRGDVFQITPTARK